MEPDGRAGRRGPSPATLRVPDGGGGELGTDVVFDFDGRRSLDLSGLSLVLTARLKAGADGRVWVRAIPTDAWRTLRVLGLDHLFRIYPGPDTTPN